VGSGIECPDAPDGRFITSDLEKAAVSDELIGVSDPKIAIVDRDRENVPKKKSK
jgi:hypothetical protein